MNPILMYGNAMSDFLDGSPLSGWMSTNFFWDPLDVLLKAHVELLKNRQGFKKSNLSVAHKRGARFRVKLDMP